MGRLHAGDDAEPGETRNVRVGEHLRVLDAEAAPGDADTLHRVEGQRVRAVSDRVHTRLEPGVARLAQQPLQLFRRNQHEPHVYRIVTVRRVQRGASRAEGAVEPELERAHDHPAVADNLVPSLAVLRPRLASAERHVIAERKASALHESAIRGERGEIDAHLVDAGQALGHALGDRVDDGALEALDGRRRDHRAHQLLSGIDEQPGGLAVGVLDDQASRGIAGMTIDAGETQRCCVGPDRVPVDTHQRHGVIRRGVIEGRAGRKRSARPQRLVPAAPGDPVACCHRRRRCRHDRSRLALGRQVGDTNFEARLREVHEMRMSVDEAGQHGPPTEIKLGLACAGGARIEQGSR